MKNNSESQPGKIEPPFGPMNDVTSEELRQARHENQKLRTRNANLEAALDRAHSTAERLALITEAEGQRLNVNEAVREALITSLQSENKQLQIQIDKDTLQVDVQSVLQ